MKTHQSLALPQTTPLFSLNSRGSTDRVRVWERERWRLASRFVDPTCFFLQHFICMSFFLSYCVLLQPTYNRNNSVCSLGQVMVLNFYIRATQARALTFFHSRAQLAGNENCENQKARMFVECKLNSHLLCITKDNHKFPSGGKIKQAACVSGLLDVRT